MALGCLSGLERRAVGAERGAICVVVLGALGDAWPEVGLILRKKRDYNPCAQYGLKYSVLYFAFDSHALLPRANPLSRTPVREFAQT